MSVWEFMLLDVGSGVSTAAIAAAVAVAVAAAVPIAAVAVVVEDVAVVDVSLFFDLAPRACF